MRRNQISSLDQRVEHGPSLTSFIAGEPWSSSAAERAGDCCFAQQGPGAFWQSTRADFLGGPRFHASEEFGRLQQLLHECDLIGANAEEVAAKVLQAGLGQSPAPIKITAPGLVGS